MNKQQLSRSISGQQAQAWQHLWQILLAPPQTEQLTGKEKAHVGQLMDASDMTCTAGHLHCLSDAHSCQVEATMEDMPRGSHRI